MKLTLEQIKGASDEIIIRYSEMSDELREIIEYVERKDRRLIGYQDGNQIMVSPSDVIYLESVDGTTYIYTENNVLKAGMSLMSAEDQYSDNGYFRCSKSMVINIYRIQQLKSMPGNRIDAKMDNGEHVVISRRYAKVLRSILKGGE